MLGTIKVPISLKLIGQNLPKSQYDEDKKKEKEAKKNSNNKLQQIEEEQDEPLLANQRASHDYQASEPQQPVMPNPQKRHRHPKVRNDIFAKKEAQNAAAAHSDHNKYDHNDQ